MLRIMSLVSAVILSIGVVFLFIKLRRLENTVRLVEKSSKVQICDEDVCSIVSDAISKIPKQESLDGESRLKAIETNVSNYMQGVHNRIEYEISQLNMHKQAVHENSVNEQKEQSAHQENNEDNQEDESAVAVSEPSQQEEEAEKPKAKSKPKRSKRNTKSKAQPTTRVTRSRKKKAEAVPKDDCIVITDLNVEQ